MYRDPSPRRKLGPAILHKTESQDRLIEELQDRLGVTKQEQEEREGQDDWLTEGVTARPQGEEQDGGQQVEQVESRDMLWETPACPSVQIALCGGAGEVSVCPKQHDMKISFYSPLSGLKREAACRS